jgi:hypothetical protein
MILNLWTKIMLTHAVVSIIVIIIAMVTEELLDTDRSVTVTIVTVVFLITHVLTWVIYEVWTL